MKLLKQAHQSLLNLISPPFCAYCKIFLDEPLILCVNCRDKIQPVVSKTVPITKTKEMRVITIGSYQDPLKAMILAKSWRQRTISFQLGELIWQMSYVRNCMFDIIVPIPLHWTRYAWRGYNQADSIAQVIAEKTGKPVVPLLSRKKRTPYQSNFAGDGRALNVKNVFTLYESNEYKNKHILLVDDLMTTGATLKEAAKELFRSQPKTVTAVVGARVI